MRLDEVNSSPASLGLLPDPTVMLVEDDHDVGQTMQRYFQRVGMKVEWARTGAEAVRLKDSFRPDVVLVDLQLPDMDGGTLVDWLRRKGDCGIIVVSGRGEEVERVVGIERGADDYVTKPAPLRELIARIRAVHRRSTRPAADPAPAAPTLIALGKVRVDLARRIVVRAGAGDDAQIHLTTAEFVALEALIEAAPEPLSREILCRLALRRAFHAEDRGVDQLILALRRKLFDDDSGHSVIISVRSAGYAIATEKALLAVRPA